MDPGGASHSDATITPFAASPARPKAAVCNRVQVTFGTGFEGQFFGMNVFVAGRNLVRWELTAMRPEGPYRLVMHHDRGSIVEYFHDMNAALSREAELEELLIVAEMHGRSMQNPTWIAFAGGVH